MENCISHIKAGKKLLKLLNLFQINQKSIEIAISENAQLSTQINLRFQNELEIISSNGKFRKKAGNQKEKNGRICRTHLFYK